MCKHNYIKITDIDKTRYSKEDSRAERIYGVTAVCTECGKVIKAWEDGVIDVIIEKHHGTNNNH